MSLVASYPIVLQTLHSLTLIYIVDLNDIVKILIILSFFW